MGLLIEHFDLIGVSVGRGGQSVDGSYKLFSVVILLTRVFHKRGNICSTSVNKIASKAMYRINTCSGDTLSGTVGWSKLFSQGIFITSVGYLKSKFEFPKQF